MTYLEFIYSEVENAIDWFIFIQDRGCVIIRPIVERLVGCEGFRVLIDAKLANVYDGDIQILQLIPKSKCMNTEKCITYQTDHITYLHDYAMKIDKPFTAHDLEEHVGKQGFQELYGKGLIKFLRANWIEIVNENTELLERTE